jgi:serine/threonine protein kinase
MELCYGDLSQFIEANRNRGTPLDHRQLWNIIADIVDGLIYAHEMGWSHQNLKPRNSNASPMIKLTPLVLAKHSSTDSVGRPIFTWKIGDWGIAPITVPPPTPDEPQTYIPTSDDVYRAPEHRHFRSAAVDIWSVGCILFELATNGVLAFPIDDLTYNLETGKTPVKIATMKTPQVPIDPHGHINRVLTGCLSPEPANRPTARQLGTYVNGILGRI